MLHQSWSTNPNLNQRQPVIRDYSIISSRGSRSLSSSRSLKSHSEVTTTKMWRQREASQWIELQVLGGETWVRLISWSRPTFLRLWRSQSAWWPSRSSHIARRHSKVQISSSRRSQQGNMSTKKANPLPTEETTTLWTWNYVSLPQPLTFEIAE